MTTTTDHGLAGHSPRLSEGLPATTPNRKRLNWSFAVRILLLLLAAALTLGPVLWTLSTSLRSPSESFKLPPSFIPWKPDFTSYGEVFQQLNIFLLVLNSALVTGLIAVGQMISAALAGYAFAHLKFRGRGALFSIVLATMMVPVQVTIVPVFMLIRGMGLSDTLLALILPAIPTAFGTFLMRQYFMGLPAELAEAASIDGASPWRTFRSVYAPLAMPGMAIVGILAFNFHWNEFFRPLLFLSSWERMTLPLGLTILRGYLGTGNISAIMAGISLAILPVLILFLLAQRYLIEGITMGGIKG